MENRKESLLRTYFLVLYARSSFVMRRVECVSANVVPSTPFSNGSKLAKSNTLALLVPLVLLLPLSR